MAGEAEGEGGPKKGRKKKKKKADKPSWAVEVADMASFVADQDHRWGEVADLPAPPAPPPPEPGLAGTQLPLVARCFGGVSDKSRREPSRIFEYFPKMRADPHPTGTRRWLPCCRQEGD